MHYNDANNHGRQVKHTNHNGRQHMTKYWFDLDDQKNKWSRHRSFLYRCDWSPGIQFPKLSIRKSQFKKNGLVRNNDLEILRSGVRLHVRKD